MHVDFATRIAAKRSLSLLTMQLGHTDRLTLVNYTFHDTQLSLPYSVMNKFTCTSFKKNIFEFEILRIRQGLHLAGYIYVLKCVQR